MIFPRSRYGPIGLDVGARAAKAVQLLHIRGKSVIHAAASIPRLTPGEDLNPAETLRILAVLRRQGFVGDRAVLCISPSKMLAAVMDLPSRSSGAPLDVIARQELARTCKREPNTIELAWWELPSTTTPARPASGAASAGAGGSGGNGVSAMALGCTHEDADSLLNAFTPTNLDILAIDTPPTALARACASLAAEPPDLTAILSLGFNAAQILILRGTTLVYERTLAEAGLRLLLAGISHQLSSDPELSDFLLNSVGCAETPDDPNAEQSSEARAIIGAHADALAGELRTSIAYAARRFDAPLTRVLLAGSGADIPGLVDRIAQRAGVDAITARADELCPASPDLEPSTLGPGAALALGLAWLGWPAAPRRISSSSSSTGGDA